MEYQKEAPDPRKWYRIYNCREGKYGEPFKITEEAAREIMADIPNNFILIMEECYERK